MSKHGGGGRYGAALEFKGENFLKKMMMNEMKKKIGDIRDFQEKNIYNE
jgi:hypothetical protein